MKTRSINHKEIALLIILISAMTGLAQTSCAAKTMTHAEMTAIAQHQLRMFYGWFNSPWSGNDAPYAHLRMKIDKEATNAAAAERLAEQYQGELAKQPKNASVRFAFYYANYLASTMPGSQDSMEEQGGMSTKIELDFWQNPQHFPHTYNYARLFFLSTVLTDPDPKLVDIGARLMRQNPSDFPVAFDYDQVLAANRNPADQARALSLAKYLVQRYPNNPLVYGQLANVYYCAFFFTKSPSDRKLSIADYQKFLQIDPANDPHRHYDKALVAQMQADPNGIIR